MRVTSAMLLRTALANINSQRLRLAQTQEQATSGLRVNKPSDDPVAARLAMQVRSAQAASDQFERNVGQGQVRLRKVEVAVDESVDVIVRARELAIQASNDTLDANSRLAIAQEIASLHDELLANANARHSGAYVFAGYQNDAPAFTASGGFVDGQPPPTVTYQGDGAEIEVEVEAGVQVASTLEGRRVFLGDADGDSVTDPGREDLFDLLATLWNDLQNNDAVALRASLDRFDRAQLQLNLEQVRAGAAEGRMDAARDALGRDQVSLEARRSEAEDADSVEVYSNLVIQENALRAALDATSRVLQPSLMDFLR